MALRRIAAFGIGIGGFVLLGLTILLLADGTRALISSTMNTGLTLGTALLLGGFFMALPAPSADHGPYRRFTPLLCVGLFIIIPALTSGLVITLQGAESGSAGALGALLGHIGVLVVVVVLARMSALQPHRVIGPLPRGQAAWASLLLTIPLLMLSWGELALVLNISAFFTPAATETELSTALVSDSTLQILRSWIGLSAIVLSGPLIEEVVFRGLLLEHWRERRGTFLAILGSSAVFALIHLEFFTAGSTFVMGLVTALVYLRFGSILLPFLIHALHNFGSAILVSMPQFQPSTITQVQSWLWPGIALLTVGGVWIWLALRPTRQPQEALHLSHQGD